MKKTSTTFLLLSAISLISAGFAMKATAETSLDSADNKFVTHAALSGKAEVQISELGVKKSESVEVKAIAEEMVKAHTAVNGQISDLAKNKGLTLSTAGDPAADKVVAELETNNTGKAFDKAYLMQLQKSHKACVAAFKEASEDAKDVDVKAWATTTLPALQAHLDHIDRAIAAL